MSDFDKCVNRKEQDGQYTIACKLGLWSVAGSSVGFTEQEAHHYWIQYYNDGEYNKLLNPPPTNERNEEV